MKLSYLDHQATSPMPAKVLEAYVHALKSVGNPASTHSHGQQASGLLEQARIEISTLLGLDHAELTFTSGGTESINIAIKGLFWNANNSDKNKNIILLPRVEHHASLEAVEWLEKHSGAKVAWLEVNSVGALEPATVAQKIAEIGAENIALISFMWANNEVGSITDVVGVCEIARQHGIDSHVDAVAALGQVPINFRETGATMVSVSAHKIGGPVGVGALLAKREAKSEALFHGGSQQRFRAGTQDVAGAHAFAAALRLALSKLGNETQLKNLQSMRDKLIAGVKELVPDAQMRGADPKLQNARLPGNAHFTFPGCQGDSLLFLLDTKGVSVSVGSACQAGVQEISHVLLNMGIPEVEAIGSLRISLGYDSTEEEVQHFLANIAEAVADARKAGITSIDQDIKGSNE